MSDEPLYCPQCGDEFCKGPPTCPGWDASLPARYCETCGVPEPCPHCAEDLRRRREAREQRSIPHGHRIVTGGSMPPSVPLSPIVSGPHPGWTPASGPSASGTDSNPFVSGWPPGKERA